MTNVLEDVLYPAVDAVRDTVERGEQLEKSPDAPLFGDGAPLTSLGLVTFVIEVEDRVATVTGKAVRLVSSDAMSRKRSPFRTLGALASYIDEQLKAEP
jgi:hypothetical protein